MTDRLLHLDYCPACDLPTFDHEQVEIVGVEFYHRHCFDGTKMVAKRNDLLRLPGQG